MGCVYTLERIWCHEGRDFWFYCTNQRRKTGSSVPRKPNALGNFCTVGSQDGWRFTQGLPLLDWMGLREGLPYSLVRRQGLARLPCNVWLPPGSLPCLVFSEVADLVEPWRLCPVGRSEPVASALFLIMFSTGVCYCADGLVHFVELSRSPAKWLSHCEKVFPLGDLFLR